MEEKGDIREKLLSERLPEGAVARIHQDIGKASMCWTEIERAGIFKSEEASAVAYNLCHFVADLLDAERKR